MNGRRSRTTRIEIAGAVVIVCTIVFGLWIDSAFPGHGQTMVNLVVWAVFAALLLAGSGERRWRMSLCLGLAWTGELVLTEVFGLYEYRLGSVPLFVPPGHVLLFLLGGFLAQRLSDRVIGVAIALGLGYSGYVIVTGADHLSLILFAIFLATLTNRAGRRLYATMLLLALALEVYGTSLGCWAWQARIGGSGVTMANPPLAAGAFYCMLDLLVLAAAPKSALRGRTRKSTPGSILTSPEAAQRVYVPRPYPRRRQTTSHHEARPRAPHTGTTNNEKTAIHDG